MNTNPENMRRTRFTAKIIQGHRVASGLGGNPDFPGGTLRMQTPFFQKLGLDLTPYYPGTLNVSLAPRRYQVAHAPWTFPLVKWHPVDSAETFSFFHVWRILSDGREVAGLVYYPHPETKPKHFQPDDMLELLFPKMDDLAYGAEMTLEVDPTEIEIYE